ncbi:MAG TPA: SHOCT domain-containing protein [Dongiaceae bacterium]|nr:SHOCT domain-containing protein [Dongiaceae bacterium]
MRYARSPGWVYLMLIVMGIGFTLGSFAFDLFIPAPAGPMVGVIWFLMGAGFVFFSLRVLRGRRRDEEIRRTGTRATATLISATTTGWTINNVPQWALRLQIDGAGAPYETTLKLLTFNPPSNGATFGVRIDPMDSKHVVMSDDDDASAPPAQGTTPAFGGNAPQIEAAVVSALRQAGLAGDGATTTLNPDGCRTITSTTISSSGDPTDPADTVRLLADLDRMRASGALGDAEFEQLKRKLLDQS